MLDEATVPRIALIGTALAALVLLLPASAAAHLEVTPKRADPGATRAFTFSIENEESGARTVRLDVQLPPGVRVGQPSSLGGWKFSRTGSAGALRQISFRAGKPLGPGNATRKFVVSMTMPRTPGATVSFKGVQTYDNGDRVRWIGPPGSNEPAPTVQLSKGAVKGATGALGTTGRPPPGQAASKKDDGNDDGGISGGLIAVLVAAGVAVVGGAAYLFSRRNRRQT